MPLLIDGYNLLHVTGIVGRGKAAGSLQGSRVALLNFLAGSIDPQEVPKTTVVFDAQEAPPGLPRTVCHQGMTVRFAARDQEADDLLEQLISAASAPRRLIVVSSDHRVQRAAKRRKATAVDSDVWYAELIRARRERQATVADKPARPAVPLLEEDVNYWLRQFGGEAAFADLLAQEEQQQPIKTKRPRVRKPKRIQPPPDQSKPDRFEDLDNPFPPGYGDDLLDNL